MSLTDLHFVVNYVVQKAGLATVYFLWKIQLASADFTL